MLLFLDVDGVLLGKKDPRDIRHCMAGGCDAFIDFALGHFDCYWLTSHCRGDAQTVIDYLRPYAEPSLLEKLQHIRPTCSTTFKTEALHGDFLWMRRLPARSAHSRRQVCCIAGCRWTPAGSMQR